MRSFFKKITSIVWEVELIPTIDSYSKTMRLVVGALLGSIAVILQSAGTFAGIGYILSMMSTGPLVLASLLSLRIGVLTYFVTTFLLAMFQPSEVLVFLFTTGLLGLSLGIGLKYIKRNIFIIPFGALSLTLGISILLYVFKFPILGPSATTHFSSIVILGIFSFSIFYSWIWKKLSIATFKVLNKIIFQRLSNRE